MRKGGVNRLSFGAQTFRDDLLVRIGRTHNAEEIEKSFFLAREQGFRNLSLDLIFGLPTQTVEDVRESLYRSLALQPKHFSCYSLKVEKGTVFHYLYERDQLPLPSEEAELEMYQQIRKILAENGYYQYEVSNFSIPGYESKHNITYWKNEPYYGLGAGAHGYVGTIRHANIKGIPAYLEALQKGERPIAEQYEVSPQEDRENFMILGLRLTKGIEKDRFLQRFKVPIEAYYQEELERLCQRGLINITEKHIFLTESGLLYGNDVFAEFLKD
jgi:oxygen-independent coproporphyrinogen-3 oxidase